MIKQIYILKVKGKAKIPDYLQIRDENFTLDFYIRIDRMEIKLKASKYSEDAERIQKITAEIPFGVIKKIDL